MTRTVPGNIGLCLVTWLATARRRHVGPCVSGCACMHVRPLNSLECLPSKTIPRLPWIESVNTLPSILVLVNSHRNFGGDSQAFIYSFIHSDRQTDSVSVCICTCVCQRIFVCFYLCVIVCFYLRVIVCFCLRVIVCFYLFDIVCCYVCQCVIPVCVSVLLYLCVLVCVDTCVC